MRCLFVDTSSFFINVGIIEDNNILYYHQERIEKDMSSKIMPIIREGFLKVDFELKDIDKLFVVNGPGSFTGVRVGVTVAKTIGWTLNIDLIPLSSLEVISSTATEKKYRVGLIDARRGNVFAGIYDNELNCVKKDRFISLDDLNKEINEEYELIGLEENKIKPDILKVVHKHINDNPIQAHKLKPNYLKKTEAEEKLNDKQDK